MRTVLHRPRQRKRSIAAATLSALAILGSLLVATPAQALNDTGTGGVFVPATGRFLDTAKNIGGYDTAMPAKGWRTIQVTGKNGVPNDGSVGAVSVVATAASISNQGILNGRPNADAKSTLMGIYGGDDKQNTSFSAVLAVNSDGTIQVQAETSIRLILDVQGYYTASDDGTAAGGFVPLNGTRIADTRSGLGFPQQTIGAGERVDLQVTGRGGIPKGASGAIINMIAVNRTASVGYLTPYATGDVRPSNSFNYAGNVPTSMQAQVKLSADGKITIYNASSTIDLVVDTQGYFTAAGKSGAVFTPGAGRAYDTRTSGNTVMGKNETRSIQIAGKAGVPVMGSGINAVVLSLTSLKTTAGGGSATVWADGTTKPNTTSINFDETTIRTNTITVPLGANGKIAINNVADATNYVFDVQGWYANPATPNISCPTPYANGSWTKVIPDSDIDCALSLPAASSSEESWDVVVDDVPYDTLTAQDAPSTASVTVSALPGRHLIKVLASGTTVSSYTFSLGQWESVTPVPSPAAGGTAQAGTALSVAPSGDETYPVDVSFDYTVWADSARAQAVADSGRQNGDWVPPTSALHADTTYYWSVAVTGSTSAGIQTVQSPLWPLTIHNPTADELSAPTFQYTDGDDLQALVQSGLNGSNSTQVADLLDSLAASAGEGKDVGLAVVSGQTPDAAANALSTQADAVRSGALTPDSASTGSDSERMMARSSNPEWNDHIGQTPLLGNPVSNKKAWEAITYVHGLQCRAGIFGAICDEKDKWQVRAVIDPGINGAAVTLRGTRQLAERNIIGKATWEWQAFRLQTVNGHEAPLSVPTKSTRYGMGYYTNVKKFDSTFWFRVGGTSKGIKRAAAHTDTAYCGTQDCKWE